MTRRHLLPRRLLLLALLLAGLLPAAGCFEQRYAERLETSRKIWEHEELLNQNLGARWESSGLSIRPPMQLQPIPAPAPPPPKADGEEEGPEPEPELDRRQPDYLGIELPGLVGAWTAPVDADTGSGIEKHPVYMYLLSNYDLFKTSEEIDPKRIDPLKYTEHLVRLLANTLDVKFEEKDWVQETYPPSFDLVPRLAYSALVINDKEVADVKSKFMVYLTQKNDIQVALLFVIPEGVVLSEKIPDRIRLSLETLKVDGQRPGTGAPSATGGPGPSF